MKTIKVRVEDNDYSKLVEDRRRAGLPTVAALFLLKCGVLDDQKTAAEIVKQALQRAKKRRSGDTYLLAELFKKREWAKFSKGARLRAGKMFNEVVSRAKDGVRAAHKTSSGHQVYTTAEHSGNG